MAAYAEVLRNSHYMDGLSLRDIEDVASRLPFRQLDVEADEFFDLVSLAVRIAR